MFTESMGVNVKDMDKPLTQDALVAISMLERKTREARTEVGVYFQQTMTQLRLKAVRAKAAAMEMRTSEGSQEELNSLVATNYTMTKELSDETFKSHCLMDSPYGCGPGIRRLRACLGGGSLVCGTRALLFLRK